MKSLLIIGAGGHANTAFEIAQNSGCFSNINFLDDCFGSDLINFKKFKKRIIGKLDLIFSDEIRRFYESAFVAIGDNKLRSKLLEKLLNLGYNLPIIKHESAIVSRYAHIKSGSLLSANSVVQAFSKVETGSIINTSSTVDHDCDIGRCVHICPGVNIAGNVQVGNFSFIGIGSSVIQNIKIGENVVIGAGSKVFKDINSNTKFIEK